MTPSTSSRTRLRRDWLSKGLAMWPSARAERARASSRGSEEPVSSSTGISENCASFFRAWQSSYPFMRGMTVSASTMSGRASRALRSASSPLSTAVIR